MSGKEEDDGRIAQVAFILEEDGWYRAMVISTSGELEDYEIARIRFNLLPNEEMAGMWRDIVLLGFQHAMQENGAEIFMITIRPMEEEEGEEGGEEPPTGEKGVH